MWYGGTLEEAMREYAPRPQIADAAAVVLWAVLVATAMAGCRQDGAGEKEAAPSWRAVYDAWEEPDPIPDFPLVDQEGDAFRLGRYEDAFLLVGFVFTRCPQPKACPLTMKKMREIQVLWKAAAAAGKTDGRRLELLAVTLDPEFDSPQLLKAYGTAHGASFDTWTLATGEPELVSSALPSLFNVLALPGGDGAISHTVKVGLLRPGLEFLEDWSDNSFEPSDIVKLVLETPRES